MQWFGMALAYSDFGSCHDSMRPARIAVFSNYCQKLSHFLCETLKLYALNSKWLLFCSLHGHNSLYASMYVPSLPRAYHISAPGCTPEWHDSQWWSPKVILVIWPWTDTLFGKYKGLGVGSLSFVPFTWAGKLARQSGQVSQPDRFFGSSLKFSLTLTQMSEYTNVDHSL